MKTIIVKDSFYNSSIVQGLRMLYSKSVVFLRSEEIIADLVFPFCESMSFVILYPDNLNKDGASRLCAVSQLYSTLVVIVCISPEEALLYENFLCLVPKKITALVCFPHENFQRSVSSYIYETVDKCKRKTRELEKQLRIKKENGHKIIFDICCCHDIKTKEFLLLVRQDINTIRNATKKGISELLGNANQSDYNENDSESSK